MIIKSRTRKDASFRQLVNYIMRETSLPNQEEEREEQEVFTFLHNFDDAIMPDDMDGIADDFLENSKFLKARKNGVMLYHEIASFAPEDSTQIDRSVMEQLSRKYIDVRAKNAMVLARPHFDKGHVHIHFLISGNERGNGRRMRVSKSEFTRQRREVEQFQLERFPQLNKSYVHSRDKEKYKQQRIERISDATKAMRERGAKQTIKTQLAKQVLNVIPSAQSLESIVLGIQKKGHEVYERGGIPYGIIQNGKRYRFSKLLKNSDYSEKIALMLSNARELEKAKKRLEQVMKKEKTQERKRKR